MIPERRRAAAWLFVPGAIDRFVARVSASPPDAVVFDLEDGVAPDDLHGARRRIRRAAVACAARAEIYLRTHAADHPAFADDIAAAWGEAFTGVVVPKVTSPDDVRHVERTVMERERTDGTPARPWSIVPMIESAIGLERAAVVLQASPRVAGVAIGAADLAADLGLPPAEPSDVEASAARDAILGAARARVVVAAAASGIVVRLETPPMQWADAEALVREARRARAAGFTGRLLVHPEQVEPTRRGFAPGSEELRWARSLSEEAARRRRDGLGGGAWRFEDRMIDEAVLRQARALLGIDELG